MVKNSNRFVKIYQGYGYADSPGNYKIVGETRDDAVGIKNFKPADKKVIVHAGQKTFMLSDFKLDSTFLSGNISEIDSSLYFYNKNNDSKFI